MAKQKRGPRGIPGPRGPAGPPGKTGHIGPVGHEGPRGPEASVATPTTSKARNQLLHAVDRHIDNIYSELTVHMRHITRLQAEVDEVRAKVKAMMS